MRNTYDLESGIDSVTGEESMKNKKIAPRLPMIHRAMLARLAEKEPNKADLKECERFKPRIEHLKCLNGKRSDRPECGYHGSMNIPYYVAAGLGDWEWIAAASQLERDEGNFHRENGSPGEFYHGGVIECKLLAEKELRRLRLTDLAGQCRLAVRSNLAWNALTAFPVERKYDILIEAGKRREGPWKRKFKPPFTCPTSGNRFTAVERSAICGGNSPADILWKETSNHDGYGLNIGEILTLTKCIHGHFVDAIVICEKYLFGTINTPDIKWRFRLRRFKEGSESIFFGPLPNPLKPCRAVTQIYSDGRFFGMKPSPRGKQQNWGSGTYNVEIKNGMIHAECGSGEAELLEMTGNLLWEVNVVGSEITITR